MQLPQYKREWDTSRTRQFIREICSANRLEYKWGAILDYVVRRADCNAIYVGNEIVFSNYLPDAHSYHDHVCNMYKQFMGEPIKEQGIDELVQSLRSLQCAFILHVFVTDMRISFLHLPAQNGKAERNVIRVKN